MKIAKTLGAVHTHTHTHTGIFSEIKKVIFNKVVFYNICNFCKFYIDKTMLEYGLT